MSDSNKRRLRDAASGPGTLISEGCKINGAISGSGHFMINGSVEGECHIDGSVTLAKNGYWKGTINAETVIVAGTIEGDVVARGRVEISDTAKINGTVSGQAIAVAEGAVVQGVMKTTGQADPHAFTEKRQAEEQSQT
ncbi:MAG: cytoskeletal protein CcmA (bactofilin family) [Woeseiaceae bacterium]|jgi:cytoskeletal protein CcmA (bactofilin family)